ncbi:unnamed protein product [Miscanthus lutarioriparius]|uniref:Helitron helicase-like domain-containing protein n=1 Tax=Miscanthus lutarioriparius TaxID=422564 RepID=A0A811NB14_9POAL|nr:unnamed protein product [Miscanthus lutarioriparius]
MMKQKTLFFRIVGPRDDDPPQYSLPTTDQLAMSVVGDFSYESFERDIIVQKQAGDLQQISALHPAFMALQYPLLFPYAERGWQAGVLYAGVIQTRANAHIKVTMQDYCYMFHYRKDEPNPYLCYGALSGQAKVDARACVDENRLWYIVENQADIRMESIQGICDAINRGSTEGSEMGKMTVLPASHTGGRRYKIQNYHDGIAICREYGPPDFFVTFTCNPKWPEITKAIFDPGQKPVDRNDLIVRVFNMKLEELLHDIKAEIPDPKIEPLGYALVSEHMIHGPCGKDNPKCPCMKKKKCSKHCPKPYEAGTIVNKNGFAVYKRRTNALFVKKGGFQMDNR